MPEHCNMIFAGLMGDFRTAWITLCNPRSMFVAQVCLRVYSIYTLFSGCPYDAVNHNH